jgi:hypothetical protein
LLLLYSLCVIAVSCEQLLSHLDGRSYHHRPQQHDQYAAQSKHTASSQHCEHKLDSKYDESSNSSIGGAYDNSYAYPQQQQQTLQRDSSLRSTTTAAAAGVEFKSDAPTPSRSAASSKDNKDRVSILVVDDSNISSKLAVRKLAALGHDTVHAENGQVALDILRAPGGHNVS